MELRIKEILKEKGLSLKDVAERIGMDASNLNSSLKKGNPRLSTLTDVANAIGCDITELFKTNDEKSSVPKGDNQALVLLDGELYKLTKAKDVVKLPIYTDYSELRNNLRGFVLRAEKYDKKYRNNSTDVQDREGFCIMGMVESFEVFSLVYAPETTTFHLAICYKNGKFVTSAYDAKLEYNNPNSEEGEWDTELLYTDIRNDIERWVVEKQDNQ